MIMVQLKRRKDKRQSKMMSVMKGNLENCCWAAAFHSLFTWSVVHFVLKGELWPIKKFSISYFLSFLGIVIRSDWPLVSWGCHPKPDQRDHLWKQNHLCLITWSDNKNHNYAWSHLFVQSPSLPCLQTVWHPLPEYRNSCQLSAGYW